MWIDRDAADRLTWIGKDLMEEIDVATRWHIKMEKRSIAVGVGGWGQQRHLFRSEDWVLCVLGTLTHSCTGLWMPCEGSVLARFVLAYSSPTAIGEGGG